MINRFTLDRIGNVLGRLFSLLVTALLLGQCIFVRLSSSAPVSPNRTERIQPGSHTEADVVAMLGAPDRVLELHDRTVYIYEYAVAKVTGYFWVILLLGNYDWRNDRVWIFFDEDQIVSHIGTTRSAEKTEYAFPWEDLHDQESGEAETP